MASKKDLVQEIAVFGEAGSGKTVLVSSFYGLTQEPAFTKDSPFDVIADSTTQSARLMRNYLRMRDDDEAPLPTSTLNMASYSFEVRLKKKSNKSDPTLRMVWHDYPGEWFESDASGPDERERRVATFRSLMGSNVALLLVDGQQLLEHSGREEIYLKKVFSSYRHSLLNLKPELIPDGGKLITFPRIWMFALTKSDLLPEMTVKRFQELIVKKVLDEVEQLRETIDGFVEAPEAVALGDDLVLLSSATFTADRIDLSRRVGVDLMLPIAAVLPLRWHARWASLAQVPHAVAKELLNDDLIGPVLDLALRLLPALANKLPGPFGKVAGWLTGREIVANLVGSGVGELVKMNERAMEKNDFAAATLTQLLIQLDRGEEDGVLIRGAK